MLLQPAALCAEKSSCEGEGLSRAQAGEPTCFRATARDRFGNLRTAGGDDVSVQVASVAGDNHSVSGSVANRGRGVYKVGKLVCMKPRRASRIWPTSEKRLVHAAALVDHAVLPAKVR